MGHKKIQIYQVFTNGVMSGTSSIYSSVINAQNLDNIGLEIIWNGTPTGTISIAGAINNPETNLYSPSNPIPAQNALTFNPALAQPSGSAGGYLINLNQFPWFWYQVQYTNTSGSGLLNVYVCGKDIN